MKISLYVLLWKKRALATLQSMETGWVRIADVVTKYKQRYPDDTPAVKFLVAVTNAKVTMHERRLRRILSRLEQDGYAQVRGDECCLITTRPPQKRWGLLK